MQFKGCLITLRLIWLLGQGQQSTYMPQDHQNSLAPLVWLFCANYWKARCRKSAIRPSREKVVLLPKIHSLSVLLLRLPLKDVSIYCVFCVTWTLYTTSPHPPIWNEFRKYHSFHQKKRKNQPSVLERGKTWSLFCFVLFCLVLGFFFPFFYIFLLMFYLKIRKCQDKIINKQEENTTMCFQIFMRVLLATCII